MRKRTARRAIRVCLFLLVFSVCLYGVTQGLMLKEDWYHFTYRQEPEDSIQVVFLGASHMFCAVDPFHLYQEHGVTSYIACSSSQSLDLSLLVLQDFLKRQQEVQVVVLEVCTVANDTSVFAEENLKYHRVLDSLPRLSEARWQGIMNLVPFGEQSEYVLPIIRHHERWRDLSILDFTPTPYRMKGAFIDGLMLRTTPLETPVILPPEDVLEPVGFADVLAIQEYCDAQGVELLLIYAPILPTDEEQRFANYLGQQAEAYGLNYINYLQLVDELDMNYATDFMDAGHLNASGQAKLERHLYKYMMDRYPLADRREDPAYAYWREDTERYHTLWQQVTAVWEEEQHAL